MCTSQYRHWRMTRSGCYTRRQSVSQFSCRTGPNKPMASSIHEDETPVGSNPARVTAFPGQVSRLASLLLPTYSFILIDIGCACHEERADDLNAGGRSVPHETTFRPDAPTTCLLAHLGLYPIWARCASDASSLSRHPSRRFPTPS